MSAIKHIYHKYKEIIRYLFFGGLTTIVSAVSYFTASWGLGLSTWVSSVISWVLAVLFAYVTNRAFVFQSNAKSVGEKRRELFAFYFCRIIQLGIYVGIMTIFVDILHLNEAVVFVFAQIVSIVFNYVASKYYVFKVSGE
ncbi:MAG: GtrA family protein [Defluviitaleaceae bacterium]|nr:GtrA family protein [Defluviitaleaceae bacterium]MCL2273782.1 GtrA family protein [Defluviitaleaceae bacterium]